MDYEWLKFPQVAEIFDMAADLAKDDGRACVSEWYVMLSLLRFDSVWDQFNNHDELKKKLFHSAQREQERKVDTEALFEDAERLRESAGDNLPSPSHFTRALYHIGSEKLKDTMNRFGYDEQLEPSDRRDITENQHVPKTDAEALSRYTIELVALAKKNPLLSVSGREEESEALMRALVRMKKCCPVLVGQPGVGKTAVVEVLARRIAEGRVPDAMKGRKIYSLSSGDLIAGASYRGQYEGRLRAVVNAIKRQKDAILFVDELHGLLTSGTNTGDALTAGNILKPELASGELKFIGATTEDEYRKFIEADGALERRLMPIQVKEPSRKECFEMLVKSRLAFEKYYQAKFPDSIFHAALELVCQFIPQRRLPDKVFDVLDEAGADFLLNEPRKGMELSVERLENAVARIARLPHIPHGVAGSFTPLRKMEDNLKQVIFGQDDAIRCLCRAVKLAESGLSVSASGTRGAFFFNGPTGVGKTEIARQLAKNLGIPLMKFDMSEYSSDTTVARLIGAAPGLVGYEEGGLLVNAVRENPHCVLLLDEIEKAHHAVHRLLLQVMDAGTLTDSHGRTADFKQVYLIMTGNVNTTRNPPMGFGRRETDETDKPDLTERFAPEFRARLTNSIQFAPLSEEILEKIVDAKFECLRKQADEKGFSITLADSARIELVRRAAERNEGARPVGPLLDEFGAGPLVEKLIQNETGIKMKLEFMKGEFRYV